MKKTVLRKENVFTCVTFGALVLFVIVESFFKPEGLTVVAFTVALSVLVLSLIKLGADVAEDINDSLTGFIKDAKRQTGCNSEELNELISSSPDNVNETIEKMANCGKDPEARKRILRNYYSSTRTRLKTRRVRRALLYIYYAIFMLLLSFLLLHFELVPIAKESGILAAVDMNVLTLWSLVVVLFEIMMKDILEKTIKAIITRRLGIQLNWY